MARKRLFYPTQGTDCDVAACLHLNRNQTTPVANPLEDLWAALSPVFPGRSSVFSFLWYWFHLFFHFCVFTIWLTLHLPLSFPVHFFLYCHSMGFDPPKAESYLSIMNLKSSVTCGSPPKVILGLSIMFVFKSSFFVCVFPLFNWT